MAEHEVAPRVRRSDLAMLVATHVVLAAIGVVLGLIEVFLVPLRIFGGIEGLAAVLAFAGNAIVGSLGGVGTRTVAGALVPIIGWFVMVSGAIVYSPGGDVIIPGKLPVDPGVVATGMAFLVLGILGGGVALVLTFFFTSRANSPTPVR